LCVQTKMTCRIVPTPLEEVFRRFPLAIRTS
jgi:hypothetical protein